MRLFSGVVVVVAFRLFEEEFGFEFSLFFLELGQLLHGLFGLALDAVGFSDFGGSLSRFDNPIIGGDIDQVGADSPGEVKDVGGGVANGFFDAGEARHNEFLSQWLRYG